MGSKPSKKAQPLPIDTTFKLPSPLPSWPSGGGFAKGLIDLGGLEVQQVSTFTKVWTSHEGGPEDLGASFFTPTQLPAGFFMLGSYAQSNNKPLSGWVLVARDATAGATALAKPSDYVLLWSSKDSTIKQDGVGYFWLPIPPTGFKAVGHVVTSTADKPSAEQFRCVRENLTDECEDDDGNQVWSTNAFKVDALRPRVRGVQALGVPVGTFRAEVRGDATQMNALYCLKNNNFSSFAAMPNLPQINSLMQAYSPWIYFHGDEAYLPSSVSWYFDNGALLYSKEDGVTPVPIKPTGANLPQGGDNDGEYWIDLPVDDAEKDIVKKGDLASSRTYVHVKPMLGGTFTDVAVWVFYPFNGPAKAKVVLLNISLGKIGEHVGDWEHVTLRISNFNGELKKVYFSEHSSGSWVDASQLEFQGGNKPVVYSSLHGHASYAKPGLVLQGDGDLGIGIRNDAEKGKYSMDAGKSFEVVAAEYLGTTVVAEPPWLNYYREWGPKISYDIADEIEKVVKVLPGKLKKEVEKVVKSLPAEVLGEEGPTGPKMKRSWSMDEN